MKLKTLCKTRFRGCAPDSRRSAFGTAAKLKTRPVQTKVLLDARRAWAVPARWYYIYIALRLIPIPDKGPRPKRDKMAPRPDVMAKELQTFLDYPPMQRGASFNLDAVKAEMAKKMAQAEAASKGTRQ
jgi:hypothetical protein